MPVSRRKFLKGAAAATLLADLGMIREAAAQTASESAAEIAERNGKSSASDDYTLDPDITYLNHASIGTIPRVVQEAHRGYLELCETNPWLYQWSDPWQEPRERVRLQAAALIGCRSKELAITHNTTECFNLLAQGLPLGADDEVLFSSLNHPGASVCWHHSAEERGFSVRQFDFPLGGIHYLGIEDIVARYDRAIGLNTTVLVLPDIDNQIGLRHPVAEITKMARERNVRWVAIDGAQSSNMIPVDVKELGVDVYATSAHKWIQAPKELGLAYISEEVQEELRPMWVTWGQARWEGSVRVFEDYGTRAMPSVMALGDALSFQADIDPVYRDAYHNGMWKVVQNMVSKEDKLAWRSHTNWNLSAAVYAVEVRDQTSTQVAERLFSEHGIVVRPFSTPELNALRISPNMANMPEDVEKLVAVLTG